MGCLSMQQPYQVGNLSLLSASLLLCLPPPPLSPSLYQVLGMDQAAMKHLSSLNRPQSPEQISLTAMFSEAFWLWLGNN